MISYKNKKFDILIEEKEIKDKINQLSKKINSYYKNDDVVILSILDGSIMLTSEIIQQFNFTFKLNHIKLSSYEGGTESLGKVKFNGNIDKIVSGKNILIIEDIVDTGTTINFLKKHLNLLGCKDIKILSLLFKESKYKYSHNIDWFGFKIDDLFVIGYGMDYEYKFRGLSSIYYMLDN